MSVSYTGVLPSLGSSSCLAAMISCNPEVDGNRLGVPELPLRQLSFMN
jgi:hypothetical protein